MPTPKKSPLFYFADDVSSEKGAALITTLLLLVLMSLAGFMLLQFAALDIRLSGNDRLARKLLYQVEACALYGAQTLLNLEKEMLLPENSDRPPWIHDANDLREASDLGLAGKSDLSGLSDKEVLQFMGRMAERDRFSSKKGMMTLDDEKVFPFLEGGLGKILVVDCGQTGTGSQDLGGTTFRKYLIFTEYRDDKNQGRLLELGLFKKF